MNNVAPNTLRNFPIAIRAVALDLDGTMVDTLSGLHEAGCQMLRELRREPVDAVVTRSFIGDGIDRLVHRLLAASGSPPDDDLFAAAIEQFRRHYAQVVTRDIAPYPGVVEALQQLRQLGLPLACITNKVQEFTEPLLAHCGLLSLLDLVISGDMLPRKKPDPLPLQYCAQVFNVDTAYLLMVGDSANDTRAARAAGAPVFCVSWGYCQEVRELDCDAIVDSLLDIRTLIRMPKS